MCPLYFLAMKPSVCIFFQSFLFQIYSRNNRKFRVNNQMDALFNVFISLLYMFFLNKIQLYYMVRFVQLCLMPSGMQVREELSDLHTRLPPT
jgi:hypothetical protein